MSRLERVRARLGEAGLDALVVSDPCNVRYLTGFTGSNGFAVVGSGVQRFVTDFRYVEQAAAEVPDFERERGPRDIVDALAEGWPAGVGRVGFEDHAVSVRAHARMREVIPEGIELVAAGKVVEQERMIKEPAEVEAIRAAAALADEALESVLDRGVLGRTEAAVAWELEQAIRARGAEQLSFPPIVAAGAHGARPHAGLRDVEIERDTLLTIDWGARLDGYCSDCTRTFATGAVDDELVGIHALVREAQEAALASIAPGVAARDADAAARDPIEAAGHGEHFGHGLGHGVGLAVHEEPTLNRTSDAVLAEGHVVTVEPGVYVPGRSGARIEDLVVVRDGAAELLTGLAKDLRTLT